MIYTTLVAVAHNGTARVQFFDYEGEMVGQSPPLEIDAMRTLEDQLVWATESLEGTR